MVYVDDVIVARNLIATVTALKSFLHSQFKISYLGVLRYFLGIEVARSPFGIHLCYRKCTLDILTDTSMIGCKPLKLFMEQNTSLSCDSGVVLLDPMVYKRLVGRLLYLTITRLYLSYSVQVLS